MVSVGRWTGREAADLRRALRMSVRSFADHLGVAPRTVGKWEAGGRSTEPRPDSQSLLDEALNRAGDEVKLRFRVLSERRDSDSPDRNSSSHRAWDYETWADDLVRAGTSLAQQDFTFAASLVERWLRRYDPRTLDQHGEYLRARSLVVLADVQRDRGRIRGPGSARGTYNEARRLFEVLGNPRRAAQVDLSCAVVDEMSGALQTAVRQYEALAEDERLSPRDRARARLWVGTAMSKDGHSSDALRHMEKATTRFHDLDEPVDWSVAHQKLALAHRDLGDLRKAERCMGVALTERVVDSPLQQVRLDTAHAHLLLSDTATADDGLRLLDRTATISRDHDMSHQLASIDGIRASFERASITRKARTTWSTR